METKRNQIFAIFLTLFFGGIGLHKFYLGQKKAGIIYLVFFWTFIPCICAFIDLIKLLCMSGKGFDNKYNSDEEE